MKVPYNVLSVAAWVALLPGSFLIAQWNTLSDFPAGQTDASFSFVIDDVAYVSGGLNSSRLYSFDGSMKTWRTLGRTPGGTTRPWAFAFAYNGKGYMGGGALNGTAVTDEFYEYDPATDVWTTKTSFGGGKRDGCISFVLGDKAYVGAGFDGQFVQFDFWEYSFAGDTWTPVGQFPGGAVIFPSCFVVNGKAYVIGGSGQTETSAVFEFDPTNGWTRKADFPGTPRQAATGFVLDGMIYYGAGMAGYTQTFQDFWTYDPASDTWSRLEHDYPDSFSAWSVAFAVGERGYVGTGANFVNQGIGLTAHMYSYPFDPSEPPRADISSRTLVFGAVTVGQSSEKSLVIRNPSGSNLEVLGVEFNDQNAASKGFAVAANRAVPSTLAPLDSLIITVEFAPAGTQAVSTTLLIRTNDPANAEVPVSITGEGMTMPQHGAVFDASMLDFGDVTVGTSATRTLMISPENSAGLTVNSVAVVNPSRGQHGYTVEADRTLPATLSPGEMLNFTVVFNASDTGTITADLNVITNDATTPSATIPMSAFGVADDVTSVDLFSMSRYDLRAVPNPAIDATEIILNLTSAAEVEVRVFDMLGRTVLNTMTHRLEAGQSRRRVDLAGLPAGAYVIEAVAGDAVLRTSIVKVP